MNFYKAVVMKNPSNSRYEECARGLRQFEAEYGEDWDGTVVEYDNDFVRLPMYVFRAAGEGNFRTVLQWLGKGNIKERVNAKLEDAGNVCLLVTAAVNQEYNLMSYLLLNGAGVNIIEAHGKSVLSLVCGDEVDNSEAIRLLLGWGAELFLDGKHVTSQEKKLRLCGSFAKQGNFAIAKLIISDLGGRRCEIISVPNTRSDLVGKTCVVEDYITKSDQFKVMMEFTNEVLLLGLDNLKRRDRTPQDPGYYVECKKNRLIRRDFMSNEECQAYIASLGAGEEEMAEIDPDSEAKAEQAAADLLAELGLEELEGPNTNAQNKEKKTVLVPAGKKKKRGGKKKGRK